MKGAKTFQSLLKGMVPLNTAQSYHSFDVLLTLRFREAMAKSGLEQ